MKIDYYGLDNRLHSDDPANPKLKWRVLTGVFADEYSLGRDSIKRLLAQG
ncbi:DUF3768 domain-containing protein [Phyllobacterium zundukense]